MRIPEAASCPLPKTYLCAEPQQTTMEGLETLSPPPHVTGAMTHRHTDATRQGSPFKRASHKVTYRAISGPHRHCSGRGGSEVRAAAWVAAE